MHWDVNILYGWAMSQMLLVDINKVLRAQNLIAKRIARSLYMLLEKSK